ncbi:MAG TPA: hypothetical protein VM783_18050 [Candidatus Acidoferrum sp.]|nr:hypothetical protein [Candidatus Acidoferrum sp.]
MLRSRWLAYLAIASLACVAGLYGLWQHSKASALDAENERLESDLAALQQAYTEYARVGTVQADQRAKLSQDVRRVRQELKETEDAKEPRPIASPDQLNRLRRLTAASNAAITSAGKLP